MISIEDIINETFNNTIKETPIKSPLVPTKLEKKASFIEKENPYYIADCLEKLAEKDTLKDQIAKLAVLLDFLEKGK